MAYFENAEEVYATIGKLFQGIAEDEDAAEPFRAANTVLQYVFTEPDATITISLQAGQKGEIDFGETDLEPGVTMRMEADVAHRFWLGRVNVTTALARGQIKAEGPVSKILRLVPAAKPLYPRYKAQLEADGRTDLLDVD